MQKPRALAKCAAQELTVVRHRRFQKTMSSSYRLECRIGSRTCKGYFSTLSSRCSNRRREKSSRERESLLPCFVGFLLIGNAIVSRLIGGNVDELIVIPTGRSVIG